MNIIESQTLLKLCALILLDSFDLCVTYHLSEIMQLAPNHLTKSLSVFTLPHSAHWTVSFYRAFEIIYTWVMRVLVEHIDERLVRLRLT